MRTSPGAMNSFHLVSFIVVAGMWQAGCTLLRRLRCRGLVAVAAVLLLRYGVAAMPSRS